MVDINSALSELKLRGQSFVQAYNQLVADETAAKQSASLYAQWQSIKSQADMVANSISWINRQVDAGINWLNGMMSEYVQGSAMIGSQFSQSAAGSSYISQVDQALQNLSGLASFAGVGEMGIIPVILTVAYVTAAIAALLYVINLIYQFHQKLLLVNQGKLSATSLSSPGILSTLSTSAKWIIFGVAAIMILPAVMRSRKNNA